jgi:hypothetical protein
LVLLVVLLLQYQQHQRGQVAAAAAAGLKALMPKMQHCKQQRSWTLQKQR